MIDLSISCLDSSEVEFIFKVEKIEIYLNPVEMLESRKCRQIGRSEQGVLKPAKDLDTFLLVQKISDVFYESLKKTVIIREDVFQTIGKIYNGALVFSFENKSSTYSKGEHSRSR